MCLYAITAQLYTTLKTSWVCSVVTNQSQDLGEPDIQLRTYFTWAWLTYAFFCTWHACTSIVSLTCTNVIQTHRHTCHLQSIPHQSKKNTDSSWWTLKAPVQGKPQTRFSLSSSGINVQIINGLRERAWKILVVCWTVMTFHGHDFFWISGWNHQYPHTCMRFMCMRPCHRDRSCTSVHGQNPTINSNHVHKMYLCPICKIFQVLPVYFLVI